MIGPICTVEWVPDPVDPGDEGGECVYMCDGPGGGSGNGSGPSQDPCDQKPKVNNKASTSYISNQNNTILANTISTGQEHGANQRLNSMSNLTDFKSQPVTSGTTSAWTPGFTWNQTDGFTIGFSHGHPGGTGPSPADVFILVAYLNSGMNGQQEAQRNFYKENASVTTMTQNGSYIVRITDWPAVQSIISSSFSTAPQKAMFNASYQTKAITYLTNNPSSNVGDAGTFALLNLLPNAITVFRAPVNSSSYVPLMINTSNEITVKPCP